MYEEENEVFNPGMPPIPPGSYNDDISALNQSTSVIITATTELTSYPTSQVTWRGVQ